VPAEPGEGERQITHDITYAADLAAGQGAVLGCEE
jgi:hypothetical protein